MKNLIKEYFYFTNTERNGLILLATLAILLVLLPSIYSLLHSKEKSDYSHFKKEIAAFELSIEEQEKFTKHSKVLVSETIYPENYKMINPNIASTEDFLQLGLSKKVVQTILNYRNKGGQFFQKEDLKKIYGIRENDFQRIKNWLDIPASNSKLTASKNIVIPEAPKSIQKLEFFNPNLADQDLFEQLGFSEKTIKIIFNYRNKGGSFYKKTDLLKIYGMDSLLYQQVEPYILLDVRNSKLSTDSFKVKTVKEKPNYIAKEQVLISIDINQANLEEWKKINGVGNYYAQKILAYREKLGGFSSIDQIEETYGLKDSVFQVIKSQLKWSPIYRSIPINKITASDLSKHPYLSLIHI